jgi:hypothetical protein
MTKKSTRDAELQNACRAHSNLIVLAGVVKLLEGGLLYSESFPTAEKIIALAKKEQQRCLGLYDKARERVNQQFQKQEN